METKTLTFNGINRRRDYRPTYYVYGCRPVEPRQTHSFSGASNKSLSATCRETALHLKLYKRQVHGLTGGNEIKTLYVQGYLNKGQGCEHGSATNHRNERSHSALFHGLIASLT